MRKSLRSIGILCATILIALCGILSACKDTPKPLHIHEYPQPPTRYAYELDDSIAKCTANNAPIDNQSRGFRGETYITLGRHEGYPNSNEPYEQALEQELTRLAPDGIRLMQVYVYLIEYYNTDLPQTALDQLDAYMRLIESKNVKMLLRFAYESTEKQKNGPTTEQIERHCRQLKTFFAEREALFHRTVYAMQLGMIGLWGEGHGGVYKHDVRRVAIAVADMTPADTPIMIRTPEMLSEVPDEAEHRFGLHEDYVIGYDDPWVAITTDHPDYRKVMNKCKYAVTDGEMPWGRANLPIDQIGCIRTCVEFGFTSFSLAHNYTEEGEYHLKQWQSEYLTADVLDENAFPYNPALLRDGKISVFDYLKYHLGYQLVASDLKFSDGNASFMITNYGFACPIGYEMQIYVDGARVQPTRDYVATELTQFGQQIYTIPYTAGEISVAFVQTRDPADTIRLFNDVPYVDGRNVLYRGD